VQRVPVDLGKLLDRLSCKLRRGDGDEDVGAGGFSLTMWPSIEGSVVS